MHSDNKHCVISVIIPTLNEEKLISRTLKQFTPELKNKFGAEVIISDGGSTDSTLSIARDSADVVIEADKNIPQNIPIGRNAGAKHALGELLYFIDADTIIPDFYQFFEKTSEAMKNKKYAALTMNFKIPPDEEKLSDKLFHTFYNNYVYLLNFIGMGMGRGECQIVRKELFEKIRGYNENLPAGEDFDLYKRLRKFGKIKFLRSLTVYESPRRYRKYGYAKVFWQWTKNSVSVVIRNKAVSDKWEQVR